MKKHSFVRKAARVVFSSIAVALLLGTGLPPAFEGKRLSGDTAGYLTPEQYDVLDEKFQVHMNYFLSPETISAGGLPLTAYKVGDRARFGYSNPTEWGYFIQAWIAAAERGLISSADAQNRISTALSTMQTLQDDADQNYQGLFYPYYKMTDSEGNDLPLPDKDVDPKIPSGDNALLYASLLIAEGWAIKVGNSLLEDQAKSVKDRMGFRMFMYVDQGKTFLAHQLDANTGELLASRWQYFADEGGVVTWIAYLAGSITFDEYKTLTRSQDRWSASWQSCDGDVHTVEEAAHFNAMFTWGIRSLVGFPIGPFDCPTEPPSPYSEDSFVPAVKAHLDYGNCLGIDYPGFSDAMTQAWNGQGLVGRFTPPNLEGIVPPAPPEHIVPYAFFVPFNALPDLDPSTIDRLMSLIVDLQEDLAGYYHNSGSYPFGFEILSSPYKDDVGYSGADDGRNIFETLGHSYTVLSLFNGLQLDDGAPAFCWYAGLVSGYEEAVTQAMEYLYREPIVYLPFVIRSSPISPCDLGTFRFGSGDSPEPEERTIAIDENCFQPGENTIVLEHDGDEGSGQWLVWDSLHLRTVWGDVVWALGQNEAPPDYSPIAYDEFDQEPPFNQDFYIGQMEVSDFPKELNDLSFRQIIIHFILSEEQADSNLRLFLDTLYATHDSADYFDMRVRTTPGD